MSATTLATGASDGFLVRWVGGLWTGLPPSEIDRIHDQDTIFARGYHAGYAKAMLHADQTVWTQRLPERHLAALREALAGTRPRITVYLLEPPNRFSVRFVRVRVEILN